jgi:hypothetical protein
MFCWKVPYLCSGMATSCGNYSGRMNEKSFTKRFNKLLFQNYRLPTVAVMITCHTSCSKWVCIDLEKKWKYVPLIWDAGNIAIKRGGFWHSINSVKPKVENLKVMVTFLWHCPALCTLSSLWVNAGKTGNSCIGKGFVGKKKSLYSCVSLRKSMQLSSYCDHSLRTERYVTWNTRLYTFYINKCFWIHK